MFAAQPYLCRLPRIAKIAAMLTFPAVAVFGQTAAGPSTPAQPAAQASCPAMAATEIPLSVILPVKVTGVLDSGHVKVGKEIWFNVRTGANYPGCPLETDAPVYAKVISATTTKTSGSAELSLEFDRADCTGHAKQSLSMRLVGITAPPDQLAHMHDAAPAKVSGGARKISDIAASSGGLDAKLNPGGTPHTVKPGVVVGLPKITLVPQGGPDCSAKLTSTDKSVLFEQDTTFLLVIAASK